MKFRVFWVVLVFAVLSGVAWAEEAQRAPSADLNAGAIRLAENDQPSADRKLPQAGPSDSSNSMAYTRSGWSRYRSQQYQEALRDFQEAILLNSTNASAWFGLGNCRYGLEEYEQAAESFRQYVILRSSAEGH